MRYLFPLLLMMPYVVFCQYNDVEGKTYALIIAIDDYSNGWSRLNHAIEEGRELKKVLENQYQFDDIFVLENPDRTQFKQKLQWLRDFMTSYDNLLLVFSGHGGKYKNNGKTNYYWIFRDADKEKVQTWMPCREVMDSVETIPCRHLLMVVDACLAGGVLAKGEDENKVQDIYYEEKKIQPSRRALLSNWMENTPDGGPFFDIFLDALRNNQQTILWEDSLATYIKQQAKIKINQGKAMRDPEHAVIFSPEHKGGLFSFVLKTQRIECPIPMIAVKGGEFTMGCVRGDCDEKELPAHRVKVNDFKIAKFEVTQGLWKQVMGKPRYLSLNDDDCNDCPVDNISWDEAQAFIKELNRKTGQKYRLPTEAEWEYAAKGGNISKGYLYAGSNDINQVACPQGAETCRVGSKTPNELGMYDMTGNVLEWCSDYYGDYSPAAQNNPQGVSFGSKRVLRGGGVANTEELSKVTSRFWGDAVSQKKWYGFRLALSN